MIAKTVGVHAIHNDRGELTHISYLDEKEKAVTFYRVEKMQFGDIPDMFEREPIAKKNDIRSDKALHREEAGVGAKTSGQS